MGPIISAPQFGSTQQLDFTAARQLSAKAASSASELAKATTTASDSEERKLFDQFIAGNFFK